MILEKNGYIVDLGYEDTDSGQPDLALAQSTSYTAGAGRVDGPSHTTTWSRTYSRRQVKIGQISAAQWAAFKYFYETLVIGYQESFSATDDYGSTTTAKIDGTPEATRLGHRVIPGVGATQAYSLSFWIEEFALTSDSEEVPTELYLEFSAANSAGSYTSSGESDISGTWILATGGDDLAVILIHNDEERINITGVTCNDDIDKTYTVGATLDIDPVSLGSLDVSLLQSITNRNGQVVINHGYISLLIYFDGLVPTFASELLSSSQFCPQITKSQMVFVPGANRAVCLQHDNFDDKVKLRAVTINASSLTEHPFSVSPVVFNTPGVDIGRDAVGVVGGNNVIYAIKPDFSNGFILRAQVSGDLVVNSSHIVPPTGYEAHYPIAATGDNSSQRFAIAYNGDPGKVFLLFGTLGFGIESIINNTTMSIDGAADDAVLSFVTSDIILLIKMVGEDTFSYLINFSTGDILNSGPQLKSCGNVNSLAIEEVSGSSDFITFPVFSGTDLAISRITTTLP